MSQFETPGSKEPSLISAPLLCLWARISPPNNNSSNTPKFLFPRTVPKKDMKTRVYCKERVHLSQSGVHSRNSVQYAICTPCLLNLPSHMLSHTAGKKLNSSAYRKCIISIYTDRSYLQIQIRKRPYLENTESITDLIL